MITIACLWVRGRVAYSADYVGRLLSMCKRHAGEPFRFVCFTDRPNELPPGVEPVALLPFLGLEAWWNKLTLFAPEAGLSGRVLYLDLDSIVVGDLQPIIHYPAAFALCPPAGDFRPVNYRVVRRFNSSVMVWNAGEQSDLFEDFGGLRCNRLIAAGGAPLPLWGDQDWIGLKKAAVGQPMPEAWFPRLSQAWSVPPAGARVILCKKPKNHVAAERAAWIREAWA